MGTIKIEIQVTFGGGEFPQFVSGNQTGLSVQTLTRRNESCISFIDISHIFFIAILSIDNFSPVNVIDDVFPENKYYL